MTIGPLAYASAYSPKENTKILEDISTLLLRSVTWLEAFQKTLATVSLVLFKVLVELKGMLARRNGIWVNLQRA